MTGTERNVKVLRVFSRGTLLFFVQDHITQMWGPKLLERIQLTFTLVVKLSLHYKHIPLC